VLRFFRKLWPRHKFSKCQVSHYIFIHGSRPVASPNWRNLNRDKKLLVEAYFQPGHGWIILKENTNALLALCILLGIASLTLIFLAMYYNFMAMETYRPYRKWIKNPLQVNLFTYQRIMHKFIPPSSDPKVEEMRSKFEKYRKAYTYTFIGIMVLFSLFCLTLFKIVGN